MFIVCLQKLQIIHREREKVQHLAHTQRVCVSAVCVCVCVRFYLEKICFVECAPPTLTVESQHEYYISRSKYVMETYSQAKYFGSVSICLLNNYYKLRAIFPYFHVYFFVFRMLFYYFQNATIYETVKSATDHSKIVAVVCLVYS